MDPLGNEDAKACRVEAATGQLAQTEGDHAPARQHDRQTGLRGDDGGQALIEVQKAAVPRLLFLKAPFVQAAHAEVGMQRLAIHLAPHVQRYSGADASR